MENVHHTKIKPYSMSLSLKMEDEKTDINRVCDSTTPALQSSCPHVLYKDITSCNHTARLVMHGLSAAK